MLNKLSSYCSLNLHIWAPQFWAVNFVTVSARSVVARVKLGAELKGRGARRQNVPQMS